MYKFFSGAQLPFFSPIDVPEHQIGWFARFDWNLSISTSPIDRLPRARIVLRACSGGRVDWKQGN